MASAGKLDTTHPRIKRTRVCSNEYAGPGLFHKSEIKAKGYV